jgi:putative ABC transport system permease protein
VPFFEAIRLAFGSIRAQKLKSFFSLVGVMIGVTFLIAVVSIVQGMNVYMTDKFAGALIGLNTFQLRSRPNFVMGNVTEDQWRAWQRNPRITIEDAAYVESHLDVPATFARVGYDQLPVAFNGRTASGIQVLAADPTIFAIKGYNIADGRIFTPQEQEAHSHVVVLGWELANQLFQGRDPLGQAVQIGSIPHTVVGVVEKQGNIFGFSLDKFAIVPMTSPVRSMVDRPHVIDELQIQTDDPKLMQTAVEDVTVLMRGRRGLKPEQQNNFAVETAAAALSEWDKIANVLFLALPGLVAISLVVGGIVIMNIMLMAVAERTREIGVRKALGARRRDIMSQFVVEAATLSVTGALFGIGTGILLAFVLRATTPLPAAVAPWSIAVGVTLGVLVGVIAGVYPARQASRLDPIDALGHE